MLDRGFGVSELFKINGLRVTVSDKANNHELLYVDKKNGHLFTLGHSYKRQSIRKGRVVFCGHEKKTFTGYTEQEVEFGGKRIIAKIPIFE